MVIVNKQAYDKAIVVGNDVIVGGNIDDTYTVNRLYALYRKDKVVGYTMRHIQTTSLRSTKIEHRLQDEV